MLDRLLDLFGPFATSVVVIAHPSFAASVEGRLRHLLDGRLPWSVVEQATPTGMLDAILLAKPAVTAAGAFRAWIVWCDQVALLPATLERLAVAESRQPSPDMVLPTVLRPDPYIHLLRDADGRIVRVLQKREHDRMPATGESDVGLFSLALSAFDRLEAFAAEVSPGAGTAERNFLPFIPWLAATREVATIPCTDPREAVGINTPQELEMIEGWLKERSARS